MAKNKNKNNSQPIKADEKAQNTAKQTTAKTNLKEEKSVKEPKKATKEVIADASKVESQDPTVETPTVETVVDVMEDMKAQGFLVKDISELKFDNMSRLDANHQAILLKGATEFFQTRDPKSHITMFANDMLEFDYMYMLARVTAQNWQESKQFGLNVPKEKAQFFIDSFNATFGLALKPAETQPDDPRQTKLQFDEKASDKEAVKALKAENTEAPKAIELDVEKWETPEMARDGLAAELINTKRKAGESMSVAIMKTRLYMQKLADAAIANATTEEDKVKAAKDKEMLENYSVGDFLLSLSELLGAKRSVVVNGLCGAAYSALAGDHCMLFAHANMRRTIPVFSNEDTVSMIKACIKLKNEGTGKPIDACLAVKNGIEEPTREFFLTIPVHATDPDRNLYANERKQYHKFMEVFGPELKLGAVPDRSTGDAYRQYCCNVANAMLNIRNMYVDSAAKWDPFKVEEYKEYPLSA